VTSRRPAFVLVRVGFLLAVSSARVLAQEPGDAGRGPGSDSLPARATFRGSALARLPVDDARQAFGLSPGVVLRGTALGIATAPDLTIRGSRTDQTAVTIDGAPARFELLGSQGPVLGFGGIAALSLETGVASAEVAEARGGTIAYVTPSGGPRLKGAFTAGSEEPFGTGSTVGYNRFEGTLGGPVPGVRRLSFFVAASLQGQPSAYRGSGAESVPTYELAGVDTVIETATPGGPTANVTLPRFAQVSGTCGTTGNANTAVGRDIQSNYGYACQGLRRPLDWTTSRRGLAKLRYAYGRASALSLTGVASDLQQRVFPGAALDAPGLYQGTRTRSRLVVVEWIHTLGPAGPGGVTVRANGSWGSDESFSGPLDVVSSAETASPALGIAFGTLRFAGLDVLPFPSLGTIIRNMRTYGGPIAPYQGRNDLHPYQLFRTNPYGVATGWPTQGIDGELTLAWEHRLNLRASAEWEARRGVFVSAGADLSRTDVAYYDGTLLTNLGVNAFEAHPRRAGLFAAARLERGRLAAEAGLRADRFDAGADFPKVPGRIFTNPDTLPPALRDTTYAGFVARVYAPSRPQTLVSPRLRMAFRLNGSTVVRFGYGEHVAPPPLRQLYAGINSDLAFTYASSGFGQDVRLAKTRILDIGVGHRFARGWAVDVSAYRKTGAAPYTFRFEPVYDPFLGETSNIALLTTQDDRVTGADARLEWRAGAALSGSLLYSIASRHVSVPANSIALPERSTQSVGAWVALAVPGGWRHGSWLGTVFDGVQADLTVRGVSGLPYTQLVNTGAGTIAPAVGAFALSVGDARLPWNTLADLRVAKALEAGGVRWTAYVEVRNLLNTANLIGVFAETGADVNDVYRTAVASPEVTMLQIETPAAALGADGTIDLTQPCSAWRTPMNCVALQRVENRFGDGDGRYTPDEQRRALTAYYDSVYGAWRFHGPARTARVGLEVRF
jgi:hypothetical protein